MFGSEIFRIFIWIKLLLWFYLSESLVFISYWASLSLIFCWAKGTFFYIHKTFKFLFNYCIFIWLGYSKKDSEIKLGLIFSIIQAYIDITANNTILADTRRTRMRVKNVRKENKLDLEAKRWLWKFNAFKFWVFEGKKKN